MKTAEYKSKTTWCEPGLVIVKWNSIANSAVETAGKQAAPLLIV